MCQALTHDEGWATWSEDPQARQFASRFGVGPFYFSSIVEIPLHIVRMRNGKHYLVHAAIPGRKQRTGLPLRLFRIVPAPTKDE